MATATKVGGLESAGTIAVLAFPGMDNRTMKLFLPSGQFGRNVLTMMGGTALAQAIPVLISPVLTRLFSPADFGVLALYLSIVAIAAIVATVRYELAILLPNDDREGFDLVAAAVCSALVVCSVGFFAILIFAAVFGDLATASGLGAWLYLIPLSVFLAALYQSLSYWSNRRSHYAKIVTSRVAQTGSMSAVQILAGAAGANSGGLIAGHFIGQAAASGILLKDTLRGDREIIAQTTFGGVLAAARRHRNFPIFMVPGHLANAVSAQMPILLLTLFFGPAIAGFYALAERVMVLPSSIIGSAVGDVYRQQAASSYNEQGHCKGLYLRTVRRLAIVAFAPCLIAALFGPWLFSLVFGDYWRQAGDIAAILAVMIFFQMVSSPLSQTILLARMHKPDMLWQAARLIFSVGSIYIGYAASGNYQVSIMLYAGSLATLHIAHSMMQYKAACGATLRPAGQDA